MYHTYTDASLFSTSLPVFPHEKFNFNGTNQSGESFDDRFSSLSKLHLEDEVNYSFEDIEPNTSFLPGDENELLAGLVDDFDFNKLPTQVEDLDDDIFGSGGGLEIESGIQESLVNDNFSGISSISHYGFASGVGAVSGEHPYGEHPSRTLFVRNINSNVEDSELTSLFKQYGDIRTLYTACKQRGFVMISYYDIRSARSAMRALQNKPLRRRKLDIHFSIPKDNPTEKDINQGTLVVFNLDASVSNDDLRRIFGTYGEIKEIRETPHKRNHKFVEFYDVRAAEAALKALNRRDIAGKRIKLEPSRPGGARRSLMLQPSREQDQVGFPLADSPPGILIDGSWPSFVSPVEKTCSHGYNQSPNLRLLSPVGTNHLPGLASILPSYVSSPVKIAPIGKDPASMTHFSVPNPTLTCSPGPVSSFSDSKPSSAGTLSGPEFLWGSPTIRPDQIIEGHPFTTSQQHGLFFDPHHHHHRHVGSAPSGVPLERHFGFFPKSPESSYSENGSPSTRMMSISRHSAMYFGNGSFGSDRGRSTRTDSGSEIDNKKQYDLDLEKIANGEDIRTTLMIKNIPNKYTSKMLIAAIDETHKGTYDFLYLPIDFKNKCNVGYAFINILSPSRIISFYEAFNGKKWEKFNSEKVAYLAYARIQGKTALVSHFQNSSLMNEDESCRPILFQSNGHEPGDLELLPPPGNLNIFTRLPDGSHAGDSLDSPI